MAAGLALLLVGGPFVFFHLVEGNPPGRLSLPPASGSGGPVVAGPLSGTWTVARGSVAGYRVQEVLFGQHHTAVGRTSKVTGGIVISGTTVTAADFSVDMASVRSDQASRDAQFDGFIMETYKYRHASFHLTQPIPLGGIPPAGEVLTLQATGQLNMRGVTRTISFELRAKRTAGTILVNAEIPVTYSYWHVPNPSFAITRVSDTGIIEVLLRLVPASSG